MGVVYEALDREDNTLLALKSLSRLNARSVYRLKKEFRALCQLVHPNLVGIHHLYSDRGRWFFTMDLLEGVDFVKYVRGAPPVCEAALRSALGRLSFAQKCRSIRTREIRFREERLRDALQQLVSGVAAIHDSGRLHRDLKPSNVMVTEQGRVVILDFGLVVEHLARSLEETTGVRMAGTPAYMAPEQAGGAAAAPAGDWYAVGVMLYEVLTGRLPFTGTSLGILQEKLERDPMPPSTWSPSVPHDLDALCLDLLHRDPERRPDAAGILQRIERRATGSAPGSAVATATPLSPAFIGRQKQLARLQEAYRAIDGGKPKAVFIHGSSGMGKTALARHFLDTFVRG